MVVIDTSSLIRFFTLDDIVKAEKVKKLLESSNSIFIPEVVFPELEYVLMNIYSLKRNKLLEIYKFLISLENVYTTTHVRTAIQLYNNTNLDFADCTIAAYALSNDSLATFDKELIKLRKVKSYWT